MSWSTELWDQFDNVSKHTAKGIDYLDMFGQFVRQRCAVEAEYACSMRKLIKSYDCYSTALNPKSKKHNASNEADKEFSFCMAFSQMLKALADIAGQHEVVVEQSLSQIVKEISAMTKKLREDRKKYLNEALEFQNMHNNSLSQLDKSKRLYDKAFKESEKAHDNYTKADKNLDISRADLEKAKTNALNKERACEDCKTSYARQLQLVNQAQRAHYTQSMPKIFQQLQELEARRIEASAAYMKLSAKIQKDTTPIIEICLDDIIKASSTIDSSLDAQIVVDRYKSGMQPPDDIPFEDLSSANSTNGGGESTVDSTLPKGTTLAHTNPSKTDYLRHTFSARGFKKRPFLSNLLGLNKNEFSELSPIQRRKRVVSKIDQLNNQIIQANNERDGLITMRQAYEENEAFGDPKTIEGQLKETDLNIAKLQNEMKKHQAMLEEIDENLSMGKKNSFNGSVNSNICGAKTALTSESLSHSPSLNSASQLQHITSAPVLSNNSNPIQVGLATNNSTIAAAQSTNPTHIPAPVAAAATSNVQTVSEKSQTNFDNVSVNSGSKADVVDGATTNRTSNSFNDSNSDSALNSEAHDCTDSSVNNDKTSMNQENANATGNNQQQQYNSDNTYEAPADLPAQGSARAKYQFKDGPLGSISMNENEVFDVIEIDHGDGWTRVRRKDFNPDDDDFIGFVPTSYIDIDRFNNC